MKIRRFYSHNMRTALRQVNEEFGEDASILSSQKTASGVEIIAALEYDEELLPQSEERIETSALSEREFETDFGVDVYANQKTRVNSRSSITQTYRQSPVRDVTKENYDESMLTRFNQDQDRERLAKKANDRKITRVEWATDPGLIAMKEELGLMRTMMSEQLKGIGWERFSEKEPIKAMLTRRLAGMGIDTRVTERLLPRVTPHQDVECSWQNLLALLAKSIKINSHNILSEGGIYAFMGPTGSGKSTAIAKIAARFVIRHGVDSVVLISTDNYRLSAQQPLSGFAKILGVAVANVSKSRPITELLEHFKSKRLILIDTAGFSKNDQVLSKQLDSLKENQSIKRFLMMPATNQAAVLRHTVEMFKRFSPYGVIISKIDEATSLGEVLSVVLDNDLPVAFTTNGQRVPEDIKLAKNHQLVSKAVWLTNKYGNDPIDWQLAQELPTVNA